MPLCFALSGNEISSPLPVLKFFAQEGIMQFVMTAIAVVAGLTFSFAIALVVEELIFGKVLGLFFTQPAAVKVQTARKQ